MTEFSPAQLILAAGAAAVIAVTAGSLRFLTFSGMIAAFVVGFFIFGFGGAPFAIPLLAFFFSSSILSNLGKRRKARQNTLSEKGSTRDAGQVLANGGVAAALAVIFALNWRYLPPRDCMLLFLAALSTVNADTWATEIGGWLGGRPYLVTTFRKVDSGTSGAVSFAGLLAALTGAAFVAGVGWLAWPPKAVQIVSPTLNFQFADLLTRGDSATLSALFGTVLWPHSELLLWRVDTVEIIAVIWAAFVAAFADSVLGASLQAQYRCIDCGALTERTRHCDGPTVLKRGFRWLGNDAVNLVASLLGVLFAWILLNQFGNPR